MTPRKGNLMGVRTDIKVLDATIRDGGLCNNFDFSDEFVRELYKTNIKSGVDYMEFGYKASRTLFNEADFGKWKFCTSPISTRAKHTPKLTSPAWAALRA